MSTVTQDDITYCDVSESESIAIKQMQEYIVFGYIKIIELSFITKCNLINIIPFDIKWLIYLYYLNQFGEWLGKIIYDKATLLRTTKRIKMYLNKNKINGNKLKTVSISNIINHFDIWTETAQKLKKTILSKQNLESMNTDHIIKTTQNYLYQINTQ